jgi:hypothetical protein
MLLQANSQKFWVAPHIEQHDNLSEKDFIHVILIHTDETMVLSI